MVLTYNLLNINNNAYSYQFLNQACAGLRPAHFWFPEITFVWMYVYVCWCMYMHMCVNP